MAVAALAALVISQWRRDELKVSGFIEADEIRVGSRVGGRVAKVVVQEGQRVKRGELMVELEPYDLKEQLAQAMGRLGSDEAALAKMEAGLRSQEIEQAQARRDQLLARHAELKAGPRKQEIAAARARVELAKAQESLAQVNFNRLKEISERAGGSQLEFERATDELKSARANTVVRSQELGLLEEGTRAEQIDQAAAQLREAESALSLAKAGYREEERRQAKAAVEGSRAAMAALEKQLGELRIMAPVDGTVEAVELQPGDLVSANAPVLSIMDSSRLWVRAYVPENRLNLAVGQKLPVSVDSFAGRKFAGHISFVARQAEFTPGNVQTPEERSKQVFRIKVTLDEGLEVLRPGMSADVWLEGK